MTVPAGDKEASPAKSVSLTVTKQPTRHGSVKSILDLVSLASSYLSAQEQQETYRPFTKESWEKLLVKEKEDLKRLSEKKDKPAEGKLVDGEIKFDSDENDEDNIERDPDLIEGNVLPESQLGDFPPELIGVPLEEIDKYLKEKTCVVINTRIKKKNIFRFSATKAFFLLAPWNPLRKFAIKIATNQFFDYVIMLTILTNCVFLTLDTEYSIAEYVFLSIYSLEMIVKMTSRGLFLDQFTYLRDWWNWLDLVVILTSYITIIIEQVASGNTLNFSVLRVFRVFRILKTISIFPGLKTIVSALLNAFRMLLDVIILTLFCMSVFSLFALQIYMGVLRNKCVKDIDWTSVDISMNDSTQVDAYYNDWVKNSTNWLQNGDHYWVCGNASGAGQCTAIEANTTCLQNLGDNPNWGYTNYDNFGWALLSLLQLITLDYWEDQYNLIIRASGPWNVFFFICVVFFGSFYLINLMLAVVAMSYEEEALVDGKLRVPGGQEKEKEKREAAARKKKKKKGTYNIDPNAAKKKKKKKDKRVKGSKGSLRSVSQSSLRKKKKSKADGKETSANDKDKDGKKKSKSDVTKKSKEKLKDKPNKATAENTEKNKSSPDKEKKVDKNGNVEKGNESKPKKVLKRKDTCETLASQDSQGESSPSDSGLGSQENMDFDEEEEEEVTGPVNVYVGDEVLVDNNCRCCADCCQCWIPWLRFQNKLYAIVTDVFFDLFITFCILANTLIMATEHYPSTKTFDDVLFYSNMAFTFVFGLECFLKILAMSKEYFSSGWNIFDMIVVLASFVDLAVNDIEGLSIFRAFRVFRVFKLAQSWTTMRILLTIIFSALSAVGNLTFILIIVIFIFAVVGKVLFKGAYTVAIFGDDLPRWHFDDIGHAMMMIFRVLCGEWIEPLWDCMRASGNLCMVVFIPTLVLGNLMVLNLFLALLINSFGSDNLKKETSEEDSKFKQAVERIRILLSWRNKVSDGDEHAAEDGNANPDGKTDQNGTSGFKKIADRVIIESEKQKNDEADSAHGSEIGSDTSHPTSKTSQTKKDSNDKKSPSKTKSDVSIIEVQPTANDAAQQTPKKALSRRQSEIQLGPPSNDENDGDGEDENKPLEVEKCCCDPCYSACCFPPDGKCGCCYCCMCDTETSYGQKWHNFRQRMLEVSEHKVFEGFVLLIIIASSGTLAFEDIYLDDNPELKLALKYTNIVFAVLFTIEMVIKWIGQGFKKYFSNFWTILDFIIVLISYTDILATTINPNLDQISAFRAVRTLRAFRPLRTVSRYQGMKIVVNALMHAIPAIFNVLLVCMVFWVIFAIFGVQTFKGKFFKCVTPSLDALSYKVIPNKTECIRQGYIWFQSRVNFDSVYSGLLALYQVATFEGWMEVMEDATDMTKIDESPRRENSVFYYIFFVIFIVVGTFFTLNLFIGVIIDNFNSLKKQYEGSYLDMFLTSSQKSYYNTMKKLGNKKPQKTIKRPKNKVQSFFFDVAISNKFELTIVLLIFLNMCVMMVEHYKQPQTVTTALDTINIIFTTIFTLEAVIKIVGLRWHYFRRVWNVFDFIIVILSIIGIVLSDILSNFFVTPTLLRVVRIFRIGRVLRLIKSAKGIRKLLFALIISLPALVNIAALLILIIFIYSIIGMSIFGNIRHAGRVNDLVNFETFGRSIVLLIRLMTSAGWNDILDPMMAQPPFCNSTHVTRNGKTKAVSGGDCGIPWFAAIYMFSFTFITYLIVINTYIAVILENFNQAHEQEEVGITEDDFDMFYVVWERYDPHASQYIKYEQLSDFVAELDEPLGIPKPNVIALVSFDLPIVEGDKLHCLDILIALVRHVLGDVEETDEFRELKTQMEQKYQDAFPTRICTTIISTTMRRKKEDIAAKLLQRAWRRHKAQRAFRQVTENAMMMAGKSISGASGAAAVAQLAGSPGAQQFGSNASLRPKKSTGGDKLKPPPGNSSLYKAS